MAHLPLSDRNDAIAFFHIFLQKHPPIPNEKRTVPLRIEYLNADELSFITLSNFFGNNTSTWRALNEMNRVPKMG